MSEIAERPRFQAEPMFAGLPQSVRERIIEWARSLEIALGDDLVAIMLTGGVARGDYRPGESTVNAIVVLREATFAQLDAISSAMQAVRYGARLTADILTEAELPGSAEAFPLLFDEIRRWHITLVGRDPFIGARVLYTHRRVRIEQELREAQIGLRRAVTDALGAKEAIAGSVARRTHQVRRAIYALLELKKVPCKSDLASVLECAGQLYGVAVAALANPREAPEAAHATLTALLAAAIDDVDALSTGPRSLRA